MTDYSFTPVITGIKDVQDGDIVTFYIDTSNGNGAISPQVGTMGKGLIRHYSGETVNPINAVVKILSIVRPEKVVDIPSKPGVYRIEHKDGRKLVAMLSTDIGAESWYVLTPGGAVPYRKSSSLITNIIDFQFRDELAYP